LAELFFKLVLRLFARIEEPATTLFVTIVAFELFNF